MPHRPWSWFSKKHKQNIIKENNKRTIVRLLFLNGLTESGIMPIIKEKEVSGKIQSRERQRMDLEISKLTRIRVLHCEMKPSLQARSASENRKISGSPSGVPHPSFFPSKDKPVCNAGE
jgi:hypothetical protein